MMTEARRAGITPVGAGCLVTALGFVVAFGIPLVAAWLLLQVTAAPEPQVFEKFRGVMGRVAWVMHLLPMLAATLFFVVIGFIASRFHFGRGGAPWIAAAVALVAFIPGSLAVWLIGARLIMSEAAMTTPPPCGQPFFGFLVFLLATYIVLPFGYAVGWGAVRLLGRGTPRNDSPGPGTPVAPGPGALAR